MAHKFVGEADLVDPAARRPPRLSYVIVPVALAIWLVYRYLTGSLAAKTVDQLDAYLGGDVDTMMIAASSEEMRVTGLNKVKLGQLWEKLVKPRLEHVTVLNDTRVEVLNNPATQGVAEVSIRFKSGYTTQLLFDLFYTEGEPKRAVIFNALFSAWYIETQHRAGHPLTLREVMEGRLSCLASDLPTLQEIGLPGVFDGQAGLRTWTQIKEDTIRYIANMDGSSAPSVVPTKKGPGS